MFKVDDVIVYGTQGVCRIEGMEEKTVGGTKRTTLFSSRSMTTGQPILLGNGS